MKKIILNIVLVILIVSCQEKPQSDSNIETVNVERLAPSPEVHHSLSENQLKSIKAIHDVFIEVYPISLEETISNFKRDRNPDNEVRIWLNMAKTFRLFAAKNQGDEKLELRKEAFKLILMRSMMPDSEAVTSSQLKLLNDNEIQEILKNYVLDAKPIEIIEQ